MIFIGLMSLEVCLKRVSCLNKKFSLFRQGGADASCVVGSAGQTMVSEKPSTNGGHSTNQIRKDNIHYTSYSLIHSN